MPLALLLLAPPAEAVWLTPTTTLTGTVVNELFGGSVAAADLDGDGRDDLLITSETWSNPELYEGKVGVFRGTPLGVSSRPAVERETNTRWANPQRLATLDANGDGYPDLIVGQSNRVTAFYGTAVGPSAAPGWTVTGGSGLGTDAVTSAGDVDGDGYEDLVVGESFFGAGQLMEGRVRLFRGGPAGLERNASWSWEPNETEAWAGAAAASAGDVDGDGYDDLIVGGPYAGPTNGGAAWLFAGGPGGLSAAPVWTGSGEWEQGFGSSVAGLGDVNGDGYADVGVGSPDDRYGTVSVWLGGPGGLAAAEDQVLAPSLWTEEIGVVGAVGDVDADGYDDVVISSDTALGDDNAYLYYGDPSGLVGPVGHFSGEGFHGGAVRADVNGDGYDDWALPSAYTPNSAGLVYVFHGGSDRDGDGVQDPADCLPDDPRAFAGNRETWYDGVDGDCLGGDDFDADDDGHHPTAYGGDDCDDTDDQLHLCTLVTGTCPGPTTVRVGGMTPNGRVRVLGAAAEGTQWLNNGPCAGTRVGLQAPVTFVTVTADAAGVASWTGANLPAQACGAFYAAVDLTTCEATVAAQGP